MNKNRFGKLEEISNSEYEFTIGRNTYTAWVSYGINTTGEYPSLDYPGDSESEVVDLDIENLTVWNEDLGDWIAISPNEEIKDAVLLEIQKHHGI